MSGYRHESYASALEYGVPLRLPRSGGWLLERTIGTTASRDASSCYPLFCLADWGGLREDIEGLGSGLIALTVVTDPFGDASLDRLRAVFPDLARPFKEHFVVDLRQPAETVWDAHHRRNERLGRREVEVERVEDPGACAAEWTDLYGGLIRRHSIEGVAAFSPQSLMRQLHVPGCVLFRARRQSTTVGMTAWYVQGDVGYYHLGAHTDDGYRFRGSFALFAEAIRYFAAAGLRWLDLGAGAGLADDPAGGLARFKRGWSTGTRTAFLCGRVFDPEAFAALARAAGRTGSAYFPPYRDGVFAAR